MKFGATQPRSRTRYQGPDGFTLIELLVVIVVLGILMALLLPAINSAVKTARNAAVLAEISQLAQALESFKSTYGDYPPSRVYLSETGNYSAAILSPANSTAINGAGDITVAQLATRTLTAFRKFWPKVQLSTSGTAPNYAVNSYWYDFNGNGVTDTTPYILNGHECLVFFLGGIPVHDTSTGGYGMTGFGKDPFNPFSNSLVGNAMYNANRQPPYFEFNAGRLYQDPSNTTQTTPGIPAYYDSLNGGPPLSLGPPPTGAGPVNFYAYFSSYGNGNYDPNDVNFTETDGVSGTGTTGLQYVVGFYIYGSKTTPYLAISPSPNPYTTTLTAGTTSGTITYQKPQTFQIISAGVDGLYGVGGQYAPPPAVAPLPYDTNNTVSGDASIRQRENDNLTNFKSGALQY